MYRPIILALIVCVSATISYCLIFLWSLKLTTWWSCQKMCVILELGMVLNKYWFNIKDPQKAQYLVRLSLLMLTLKCFFWALFNTEFFSFFTLKCHRQSESLWCWRHPESCDHTAESKSAPLYVKENIRQAFLSRKPDYPWPIRTQLYRLSTVA